MERLANLSAGSVRSGDASAATPWLPMGFLLSTRIASLGIAPLRRAAARALAPAGPNLLSSRSRLRSEGAEPGSRPSHKACMPASPKPLLPRLSFPSRGSPLVRRIMPSVAASSAVRPLSAQINSVASRSAAQLPPTTRRPETWLQTRAHATRSGLVTTSPDGTKVLKLIVTTAIERMPTHGRSSADGVVAGKSIA